MNVHRIHCIENIFTVQDFWATCACLEKQSFSSKFSLYWIYFLHSGFLSNLRLPWRVPWIRCIEYIHFTVTCGEVRDCWGTVSFKAKLASIWIEWSSINSPLNWLLAEWLLLMFSTQNRRQKVFDSGTLRFWWGARHFKNWQKLTWFIVFHVSIWGTWSFVWGA